MTGRTNDHRQDAAQGESPSVKAEGGEQAMNAGGWTPDSAGIPATGSDAPDGTESRQHEHRQRQVQESQLSSNAMIGNPLALHAPDKKAGLINPVVLAYMGDAVFELLVRQYLISQPNNKSHHLHSEATKRVSAKAQRITLARLQPLLTEEEADIVRRGRNTKSGSPPRNADPADYRHATALECLFGHLYFEGRLERIGELMRAALDEQE